MEYLKVDQVFDLVGQGDLDTLRSYVSDSFDWNVVHPKEKITLLQEGMFLGLSSQRAASKAMETITWLLGKGADPGKKVTMGVGFELDGVDMDAGAEYSAASLTVQLRTEFLNTANLPPSDWRVMFLTSALAALAVVVRQDSLGAKVLIDESLQDRWERVLHASCHDVAFEVNDGCVGAHVAVLSQSSPVLQAMLSSGSFREAESKVIQVPDCDVKGLRLFLDLLYTGGTREEVAVDMALAALDPVLPLVDVLGKILAGQLTEKTFAAVAEAAALKDLPAVKRACVAFAAESKAVKKQAGQRALPASVLAMLGVSSEPELKRAKGGNGPIKKRRTY
ncbi:unnamed protein product [Effrenium voratum]|uniref:BTB domain-containing protein n=1 Tax=Effrenium voratum TaxID=2562239 RepID=A0AA36HTQ4_9DINO|nr:unnamed protein product [Effrenium voratum]